MKLFEFQHDENTVLACEVPENCCLFCVHMNHFWYTIDDGIYLTECNQCHDNCAGLKGNCKHFKSHW